MKILTPDDFKNAPPWVKSAAVDESGCSWFFNVTKDRLVYLKKHGIWFVYRQEVGFLDEIRIITGYKGYDTTDWQNSAIDRE